MSSKDKMQYEVFRQIGYSKSRKRIALFRRTLAIANFDAAVQKYYKVSGQCVHLELA
jgi:hypothetical protein